MSAVTGLARIWTVWLLLGTADRMTRLARKLMRQKAAKTPDTPPLCDQY
jgi:hypothetical protein